MQYAGQTTVSPEKSRGEIERTLTGYGATGFMYGWHEGKAVIVFEFHNKRMRFTLDLPTEAESARTPLGRRRHGKVAILKAYEQEQRRKWRSLALSIKSKLVAVQDGISTVEYEFLANIILPNGMTVGEWAAPQIDRAYESGNMPPLLSAPGVRA